MGGLRAVPSPKKASQWGDLKFEPSAFHATPILLGTAAQGAAKPSVAKTLELPFQDAVLFQRRVRQRYGQSTRFALNGWRFRLLFCRS